MDPLDLVAILAGVGGLYLLARHMGWTVPAWAYGALAALGALLLGTRRRGPVEPPPAPRTDAVRITAGDILARREAEAQERIAEANASEEREAEVAAVLDARRRR